MDSKQKKYSDDINALPSEEIPEYFLSLANSNDRRRRTSESACVAVLGTDVPEIYIRGAGAEPVYILGGSYATSNYVEKNFPQICDPVVKSGVSYLTEEDRISEFEAVIIPVSSMDARKAGQYLEVFKIPVIFLERMPATETEPSAGFEFQQKKFIRRLESITGQKLSVPRLLDAAQMITTARQLFEKLPCLHISQMAADYIRQTYYMTSDTEEWISQVQHFIETHPDKQESRRNILLTGSPIRFPNTKFPRILRDVGIPHYNNTCNVNVPADYSSVLQNPGSSVSAMQKRLLEIHYQMEKRLPATQIMHDDTGLRGYQGVIFHLLKGELNYAYEAGRLEREAIALGIPFVCIETDYSNADIEQIRIRLEAFSELLNISANTKKENGEKKFEVSYDEAH